MANGDDRNANVVLPIHVLLVLLSKENKSMSIEELCARLHTEHKVMLKILNILARRGLIILNNDKDCVRLTGVAVLYLKDLKKFLTP